MELFVAGASLFQEWIRRNDSAEFLLRSQDGQGREAEIAGDSCFDLLAQSGRRSFAGLENHVAALDVSLDVLESKRLKRSSQRLHLHPLVRAKIDSAQHGNVSGHRIEFRSNN